MSWLQPNKMKAQKVPTAKPQARSDDLIVENVDREVLIYDERSSEAHCLGPAAAQVWRACDGQTDRGQLATALGLDDDTVQRALDELEACGLLDSSFDTGVTRREAAARFVKIGAAAGIAGPLIYSIASPMPAAAVTLTTLCQAVNAVAGHDCGTKVGQGCKAIPGCCCCHGPTKAPLNPGICAADLNHCCTSAAGCAAAGGGPCS